MATCYNNKKNNNELLCQLGDIVKAGYKMEIIFVVCTV